MVQPEKIGHIEAFDGDTAFISGATALGQKVTLTNPAGEGVDGAVLVVDRGTAFVAMLGIPPDNIRTGGRVLLKKRLAIGVGSDIWGSVIDPLGTRLDGCPDYRCETYYPLKQEAPPVRQRVPVVQPFHTGIPVIDQSIPIGMGQRQLIIGDRGSGKTTLMTDAVIAQRETGVKCIYVAIGMPAGEIAALRTTLSEHGAMNHTVIVAASASDKDGLKAIAPLTGTAIGEWVRDSGGNAFVVFDDFTNQAASHRALSLLEGKTPPGREAHPPNSFISHSKILERCCAIKDRNNPNKPGGTLTGFVAITTRLGSWGYIGLNVVSITDGQIYLDPRLANQGIHPAVDSRLSVSRVGGSAQDLITKQASGDLRLSLAEYYRLLEIQFGDTDSDETTAAILENGARTTQILITEEHELIPPPEQAAIIIAATRGLLRDVPVERIIDWRRGYIDHLRHHQQGLLMHLGELTQRDNTSELNPGEFESVEQQVIASVKGYNGNL